MHKKVLGVFTLAMINVAAIVSLRNLPIMAGYGYASIIFYALAGLLYLIPTGLVCAELATGWPKEGGIYAWVSEAFGKRTAFFTIWFAWMESIAWYPAILTYTATTLAYIFDPALAQNKYFMIAIILILFWGATFTNFLGMKTSSLISTIGVIIGTLLPAALIIVLGFWWYFSGNTLQIEFTSQNLIPDFHLDNIVFFSGVLLGFAGMELAAFHALEAKNPQRDYPRAMFTATLVILLVSILGSLAIALIVPKEGIGLVEGVMQAFSYFFAKAHLTYLLPILAALLLLGPVAGINTWIIGPVKGMLPAAKDGFLPKIFQKENKESVPVTLLVVQAMLGSVLSLVFLYLPNVNTAYWVLTATSAQFTLIMYSIVFSSAIKLRYSQKDVVRKYKIPGKNYGMWLVAGVGIVTCLFSFIISFLPPKGIEVGKIMDYEAIVIGCFVVLASPPLLLAALKR